MESRLGDFQGFTVKPNPAEPGGKIQIKGEPGATVHVVWAGGNRKKVKLDENGEGEADVPVGEGKTFTVSDFDPVKPHTVEVQVVGSTRAK